MSVMSDAPPPTASSSTPRSSPRRSAGGGRPSPRRAAALARLARARLYVCADTSAGGGDLAGFAAAAVGGGVDLLQIREKNIEAGPELAALASVAGPVRDGGALLAANDRADVALLAGADVLHVGQDDLTPSQVRRLAPDVVVGLSTHDPAQLAAAIADPDVDYFCVGPVWATPTKPGRPAAGLDLVRAAAESGTTKPWFAIGGIDLETLGPVVEAGAARIVVVRAVTAAADPAAAAARLRDALPD